MSLLEIFYELKTTWRNKLLEDEWFFYNFRKMFISKLDSRECMDAIDFVIGIILSEKDNSYVNELIDLLFDLIRKTDTTEIPAELKNNISNLNIKFLQNDYQKKIWDEIKRYYIID